MCGRFTIFSHYDDVINQFQLNAGYDFSISYNVAPTQFCPVISLALDTKRVLVPMSWGLIPHWDKSDNPRKYFNARSESIAIKPAFRQAFSQRRCLVVTNGFFEWKMESIKQPYFIGMKSQNLFALAGIWESREVDGNYSNSFSLITTEPNKIVASIHDRMPVIIKPHDYDRWLSLENQKMPLLLRLLAPYPASEMYAYPVTPQMNKPVFNNKECITQLT
jgi:putative SOS response-associated peptidase YedK